MPRVFRRSMPTVLSALFLVLVLAAALWIALSGSTRVADPTPAPLTRAPSAAPEPALTGPTLRAAPGGPVASSRSVEAEHLPAQLRSEVLQGRVIDDHTGRPVETARVGVCCSGEAGIAPSRVVQVDADGMFEVTIPAECATTVPVCVLARAPDYVQLQVLHARIEERLELRLARGLSIAGVVETPWGTPIAGALVRARAPWNVTGWPSSDYEVIGTGSLGGIARSNELGAFRIEGLSENQEYDILPSKDGFSFHGSDYERVRAPVGGVKARLWPEARVRFVDERNAGATALGLTEAVWLPTIMFKRNPGLRHIGSPFWRNGHVVEERFLVDSPVDLDADIPFVCQVLTPGKGWVQLNAAARAGKTVTVALPGDGGQATKAPVTLSGSFSDGAPYSGFLNLTVSAVSVPGVSYVRLPVVSGHAQFPLLLDPGDYILSGTTGGDVESAFWVPCGEVRAQVPRGGITVQLELTGSAYTLDVRDEAGRSVRDYLVQVEREGGSASGWYQYPARESGEATVSAPRVWLNPGAHIVRVGAPAKGLAEVKLEVGRGGENLPLAVTLRAGKGVDLWASSRRMRGAR